MNYNLVYNELDKNKALTYTPKRYTVNLLNYLVKIYLFCI